MIPENETSPKLVWPGHPEAISGWGLLANLTAADGLAIGSPYELPGFWPQDADYETSENGDVPPLSRIVAEGGRVAVTTRQGGRLELWPLFSDPAGSATVQLFGFEGLSQPTAEQQEKISLITPFTKSAVSLGLAYNVLRDLDNSPQTLTMTPSTEADQVQLSILTNDRYIVVPDRFGTTWFSGARRIFNTSGFWAWYLHATSLTGNFLCLMRTI